MCMMFWVLNGRCTITIFARLSQMARQGAGHDFGVEKREHVSWVGASGDYICLYQMEVHYSIEQEHTVIGCQQAHGHAFHAWIVR